MRSRVFSLWRIKAEEAQRLTWGPGELAQSGGDVVVVVVAQHTQHGVASGGAGLRGRPGADWTGSLTARPITPLLQPVRDGPLFPDQAQERAGGDLRAQARDEVAHEVPRRPGMDAPQGRYAPLQPPARRGPRPAPRAPRRGQRPQG